ncbi:MAG TPA: hypothetical protein VKK79_15820 [Candidatus Lokiarchaeia archaeon]|nr:hypothetical protein [Candidatus Lokiarchaeia archaeon]
MCSSGARTTSDSCPLNAERAAPSTRAMSSAEILIASNFSLTTPQLSSNFLARSRACHILDAFGDASRVASGLTTGVIISIVSVDI